MARLLNLKGNVFGRLAVVRRVTNAKGRCRWECLCSCGKTKIATRNDLRSGHTQSCGCLARELSSKRRFVDMAGQRYGRLLVLSPTEYKRGDHAKWRCLCDCGNEIIVIGKNMRRGMTSSCGCFERQANLEDNITSYSKKNITSVRQKRRYGKESIAWRMSVFERDNYKCQCCGSVGGELNAHHILSWADYPAKRCDVDNGITLCSECHRYKIHKFKKKKGA